MTGDHEYNALITTAVLVDEHTRRTRRAARPADVRAALLAAHRCLPFDDRAMIARLNDIEWCLPVLVARDLAREFHGGYALTDVGHAAVSHHNTDEVCASLRDAAASAAA